MDPQNSESGSSQDDKHPTRFETTKFDRDPRPYHRSALPKHNRGVARSASPSSGWLADHSDGKADEDQGNWADEDQDEDSSAFRRVRQAKRPRRRRVIPNASEKYGTGAPSPVSEKAGPIFEEPESIVNSFEEDDLLGESDFWPGQDEQRPRRRTKYKRAQQAHRARLNRSRTQSPVRHEAEDVRYIPPTSRDPFDNAALLAETFTLPYKRGDAPGSDRRPVASDMRQAWLQGQVIFANGIATELLAIDLAESLIVEGDRARLTLYCRKHAAYATPIPKRQIFWLHVQHTAEVISTIKNLVTSCPHIDSGYQTLALSLLDKVLPVDEEAKRTAHYGRQMREIVARSDGEPDGDPWKRQTVTFISTPYFVFREEQAGLPNRDAMETLHSALHGYDGRERNGRMRVLLETQKWLGNEIVHVAHMRSLLIGPRVLLTWGELPFSAVQKDNILIDDGDLFSRLVIRTAGSEARYYFTSVKYDMSLAELNARIASLTRIEEFDISEDRPGAPNLSPEQWARLLASASTNLAVIRLVLWPGLVSRPPPSPLGWPFDTGVRYIGQVSESLGKQHKPQMSHSRENSRLNSYYEDVSVPVPTTSLARTQPLSQPDAQSSRQTTRLIRTQPVSQSDILERRIPLRVDPGTQSCTSTLEPFPTLRGQTPRPRQTPSTQPPHEPWSTQVANDQSERRRASCVYHLSSSESDNGEHGAAAEPAATASWHRRADALPMPPNRSHDKTIPGEATEHTGKPRRQQTGENKSGKAKGRLRPSWLPHNEEPVDTQNTLRNLENQVTPFLMWRVSRGGQGSSKQNESRADRLITMFKMLRSMGSSLKESVEYGKVYQGGYRCSLDTLCSRHENLTDGPLKHAEEEMPTSATAKTGTFSAIPPEVPEAPEKRRPKATGGGSDSDTASFASGVRGDLYINNIELANNVINDIFTHSKLILSLFVPINDVALAQRADITEIMDRYWGALDVSFRHLRLAARRHTTEGDQTWVVRGSCRSHGEAAAAGNCEACDDGTEYTLIDALGHLHAGHAPAHAHDVCEMPSEDPCTVWLQNTRKPAKSESFTTLLELLQNFADALKEIAKLARALQLFVAHPGPGTPAQNDYEHGKKCGGNGRNKSNNRNEGWGEKKYPARATNTGKHGQKRTTTTGDGRPTTPGLPPSIFRSFKSILTLFTIHARFVLLTSRRCEEGKVWRRHTQKAGLAYIVVENQLTWLLQRSQQELIQGIAAKDSKTVRYRHMGTEHIAAMAVANAQTGIFRLAAGRAQAPWMFDASGRNLRRGTMGGTLSWTCDPEAEGGKGTRDATDGSARAGAEAMTCLDLVALYREHARALASSANLHPQRQAFLAIRAFEDELRVVRRICDRQLYCLAHLLDVTDPRSFRITDCGRQANFGFEENALLPYRKDRKADLDALDGMLTWMVELRQTVIESIEVLDEGHVKAIRVFTLVTLFFLPLSFVTSFFGMNTADVRDMTYSSNLYWAIAAPTTLSVLGMAYLYGYKWEDLTRRIKRKTWLEEGLMPVVGGGGGGGGQDQARMPPSLLRHRFFGRKNTAIEQSS